MRGAQGGSNAGGELALIALVVVVAVGFGLVELTGVVGGIIGSGQPVTVSATEAAHVLVRLLGHLGEPAQAWPASARRRLAGEGGMIAALIAALVIVVAIVAVVIWIADELRELGRDGRSARWARARDLRELHVRHAERGRIVLGRHGRRLIAAEPRVSTLVVAPSQTGKTSGLAVPAIVEWGGPVVATSVKSDLVKDTIDVRRQVGEVAVFDPTGSTSEATATWSPTAAASSWSGARAIAAALLQVGARSGQSADESFWRPAAARYLGPLLLAAHSSGEDMRAVMRWITTVPKDEILDALSGSSDPDSERAVEGLTAVWEADERFRSSLLQTLATALDAWEEPGVTRATSGAGTIDPAWLLRGSNTLYVVAPAHHQRRLRGLFAALIDQVIRTAFEASTRAGRPIEPPLLAALDEAANVAPLPDLDEIASTAPGQGVQLLTLVQDVSQLMDRWGRERAETIIANHRARMFFGGLGDRATLDYLGATLGDEDVRRVQAHRQRLDVVAGSQTVSSEQRRLGAPNRIRQASAGTALLVYGRLAPAWIELRPWYADRALRRQVAAARKAPATSPFGDPVAR